MLFAMVIRNIVIGICCLGLCLLTYSSDVCAAKIKDVSQHKLVGEIVKLDLGFGKYRLMSKMSAEQLKIAKRNKVKSNIPGTIKFRDGNIGAVYDVDSGMILAVFQEADDIEKKQTQLIINDMMLTYGSPPTMAHNKIVYWAFNANGLISDKEHQASKANADVSIIATVKLSSKLDIMGKAQQDDQKNKIYIIITSPPVIKDYLDR